MSRLSWLCCLFGLLLVGSMVNGQQVRGAEEAKAKPVQKAEDSKQTAEWISLFDGKTLSGWESTKFGGEGEVTVQNGQIEIGFGADLSGMRYTKPLPTQNFEVELEAQRVDGSDFFCGLTFMVDKSPCSLIIGGWGGGLCGLSSLDGNDASENETATYQQFDNKKWYKIRLKVQPELIEAWVDKKKIVNAHIKGRKISIRSEVELSKPFGIATWQTTGAIRNIRIRKLAAAKPSTSK